MYMVERNKEEIGFYIKTDLESINIAITFRICDNSKDFIYVFLHQIRYTNRVDVGSNLLKIK